MSKRKFSDEQFISAVKENSSVRATLSCIGLNPTGANYAGFYKNLERLGLSAAHFTGQGHLKGKRHDWNVKIPLEEILIEKSNHFITAMSGLKKRLLKECLLKEYCSECGITDWFGKKLSLHLDHKNGIRRDNRLENLRLLCPNCHSLTPTYAGKNKGINASGGSRTLTSF